jgi:ribosomal protein L40E
MPSSQSNLFRPHLTMDEQSFQNLLSAAFTIQEHNARRKLELVEENTSTETPTAEVAVCQRCGAKKAEAESRCESCGMDEFRPGERMQRNWASMWLMSQEQGLWPERSADSNLSASNFLAAPMDRQVTPQKELAPLDTEETRLAQKSYGSAPADADAIKAWKPNASQPIVNTDSARRELTAAKQNRKEKENDEYDNRADKNKNRDLVQEIFCPQPPSRDGLIAAELVESNRVNVNDDLVKKSTPKDRRDRAEDAEQFPATSMRRDTMLTIVELVSEEETKDLVSSTMATSVPDDTPDDTLSAPSETLLAPRHRDLQLADLNWSTVNTMWRQHRADLYLGAAIFVAVLALLWPSASSPKQSDLSLWDKTLIGIGIAEAPAPIAHLPGDPGVQVWIDPHTALYYCQGDDLYGKAANGRFSTQREAQMERFEPASRSACE